LFELAEDSAIALNAYLDEGIVLVATADDAVVGHLQLTQAREAGSREIKNMAVVEALQGSGIGRRLISAACELARADGAGKLMVATAAADVGNLRFYQRQGFRMLAIERDAFTPATGYPSKVVIEGIELRDRVWLDRPV
jgi:predicted N-acetyltransferase YhbS